MSAVTAVHGDFAAALLDPARQFIGLRQGASAAQRFAVHRNNMMVALVDALSSAFPVTRELVGEAFFGGMARDYVRIDPPRSPIIAAYGAGFADFIAAYPSAAGVAYLADVARLERMRGEAFHAADAEALDPSRWQAALVDCEHLATLRVRLQPACRWLASRHPVLSIWRAHQLEGAARDTALAAADLGDREDVLVHRPHWHVQQAALPAGGIACLEALRAGATLGDAMQRACTTSAAATPDQLFALLLQHGLVTAFDPGEAN